MDEFGLLERCHDLRRRLQRPGGARGQRGDLERQRCGPLRRMRLRRGARLLPPALRSAARRGAGRRGRHRGGAAGRGGDDGHGSQPLPLQRVHEGSGRGLCISFRKGEILPGGAQGGARNADPDGCGPPQRRATLAADGTLCHGYPMEQPLDGAGLSEQAARGRFLDCVVAVPGASRFGVPAMAPAGSVGTAVGLRLDSR
mmetsp:Transcript_2410/g.4143  ORF Transcript_2410/g.4143 Transcript_2410/m.4143 type:complete len:200 (+) Transcript_2410:701-1300(+)